LAVNPGARLDEDSMAGHMKPPSKSSFLHDHKLHSNGKQIIQSHPYRYVAWLFGWPNCISFVYRSVLTWQGLPDDPSPLSVVNHPFFATQKTEYFIHSG
jgi:hypothetical protein